MDQLTLIGIGEILWDEFPGFKVLGGAPTNFAFHANRLGANGMIVSTIGNDVPGEEIISLLNKKKLPYHLSIDSEHPTGKVTVTTDQNGSPTYTIHENRSWDFLTLQAKHKKIAQKADAICFGSLAQRNLQSAKSIVNFIKMARKDCLKVFDINLRQDYYSKENLSQLIGLSNILKLNHEELEIVRKMFLTSADETENMLELVSMFDLSLIVLTKGKDGSRIFVDKDNDSVYKPKLIEIIDSVGAGDSFSAVVTLGYLKGLSLDKINRCASRVAAYVCSQKGATPQIPSNIIHSLN